MHHCVVGERGHADVVLERPALEAVSGDGLEVAVPHLRGVFGPVGGGPAAGDEQRVLGEHAFDVVAVVGRAHHDGDEVQPVLLRRLPQCGRFLLRDVVGEGDAVVARRPGAGEAGNHAIHLFRIAHVPPHEEPSLLHPRRWGRRTGGSFRGGSRRAPKDCADQQGEPSRTPVAISRPVRVPAGSDTRAQPHRGHLSERRSSRGQETCYRSVRHFL